MYDRTLVIRVDFNGKNTGDGVNEKKIRQVYNEKLCIPFSTTLSFNSSEPNLAASIIMEIAFTSDKYLFIPNLRY